MGANGRLDPDGSGAINGFGNLFNDGMNDQGTLLHRSRTGKGEQRSDSDNIERLHLGETENPALRVYGSLVLELGSGYSNRLAIW